MNEAEAAARGLVTTDEHGNPISPFYGYLPTKWVCCLFLALFIVSGLAHFIQALHYKARWLLYTVFFSATGEILTWTARLWSSNVPLNNTPFMIQIVVAILAPTPLVAALFITFARIISRLGEQYSRLSPRWYSRIFLTCDVIGFLIQAGGGGIAATTHDVKTGRMGSNIMLAGIVFQFVALLAYSALMAEYFIRLSKKSAVHQKAHRVQISIDDGYIDDDMKLLIGGIWISTFFLFVRSIYRIIELADGFSGIIIRTEVYFNIFDGLMVFLAMLALNLAHPGRLLYEDPNSNSGLLMKMNKTGPDSRSTITLLSRADSPPV